jgi:hypothetical protein
VLRWVLGGAPVARRDFFAGFDVLPPAVRPLAADFGLQHLSELDPVERDRLAEVVRGATLVWMARQNVLREIRSGLSAAGVHGVFLKGVALAEQVYPRPATRLVSDIDLWIRPKDLPGAIEALSQRGFAIPPRHREGSDPQGPTPMTYLEMHVAGGPVLLDLHVRPMSLRHLSDDETWEIWSSRVPVGASALHVLPLDAQLLHVCLHIARSHGFVSGLKALVDIAMIARAWTDDALWERWASRVLEVRAGVPVFICLELARETLGAAIPSRVLDRLRGSVEPHVVDQARELVWAPEPKLPLGVTKLAGGAVEPGWLLNRLWLRRDIAPEARRSLSALERPDPRLVTRYFWRRLASLARFLVRGEVFRPSFWRRVEVERGRHRLFADLARLQAR